MFAFPNVNIFKIVFICTESFFHYVKMGNYGSIKIDKEE